MGTAGSRILAGGQGTVRLRLRTSSHAYGALLALILASLAFQLAAPDQGWARWLVIGLQSGVLLLALRVSGASPVFLRLAAAGVAVTVLSTAGVLIGSGDLGRTAGRLVGLLTVALAPVAIAIGIVNEIRDAKRVTIRAMFGGLCIYLLLGMMFAFAYGLTAALSDDPFFAQGDPETQANFLYFSFVTQTTTGYGDLTAVAGVGRSLAVIEALLGQIYLVTVVALIVGNLRRPPPAAGE